VSSRRLSKVALRDFRFWLGVGYSWDTDDAPRDLPVCGLRSGKEVRQAAVNVFGLGKDDVGGPQSHPPPRGDADVRHQRFLPVIRPPYIVPSEHESAIDWRIRKDLSGGGQLERGKLFPGPHFVSALLDLGVRPFVWEERQLARPAGVLALPLFAQLGLPRAHQVEGFDEELVVD